MKKCTTYTIEWNEEMEDFLKIPENCLSITIANQGESKIAVDETIELEPKQAYPLEYHVGYFHTGQIRLRVVNTSAPYASFTKVHLRLTVETN